MTNTNPAPVLEVHAYATTNPQIVGQAWTADWTAPQTVRFSADFATRELAVGFAALFPKSSAFRVTSVDSLDAPRYYSTVVSIELRSTGVTGEKNETGIKRYRSIMARAAKLGVDVEWIRSTSINAYHSREAFEAAL